MTQSAFRTVPQWRGDVADLTDQDFMHQYQTNIMWVFGVTDFLAVGPVDTLPDLEVRDLQLTLADWREHGATLHAELRKRGILA